MRGVRRTRPALAATSNRASDKQSTSKAKLINPSEKNQSMFSALRKLYGGCE